MRGVVKQDRAGKSKGRRISVYEGWQCRGKQNTVRECGNERERIIRQVDT